ncbi:MAG: hypothetical protein CSA55_04445 [Ilumatobacter coccineus]|uniref:Lipoprotein n=1 Tax=Ilumatobacter coccineus TaxID=467094 RepID=A0A2G6KB06_9ACTN|nr:MAG: hypothetical protein CSA55_04445 [Ilumatobacter coccineus]
MKRRCVLLTAALLVLTACGGGSVGGDRGKVVDLFIEGAAKQNLELDTACVNDLVKKLSDEDVATIVALGDTEDPQLSPEGEEIKWGIIACIDTDALVDRIMKELGPGAEDVVDAECLREAYKNLDPSAPDFETAMGNATMGCTTLDG